MREHGTMDIDFRRRCVTTEHMPSYQIIRYGLTADEWNGSTDLDSPWLRDQYSPHVRRPGRPIEDEYGKQKFYFNKRIEVGDTVPFAGRPNKRQVPDLAGGIDGAKEAELAEWRDSDDFGNATVEAEGVTT